MFCEKCGKELLDGAVVCPNCGCWVGKQKEKEKTGLSANEKSIDLLLKVFLIATIGCIGGIRFVEAFIYSGIDGYTTRAVLSFIMGFFALACGITSFILSLKKEENTIKLISLLVFVWSIGEFVPAFLSMLLWFAY